MTTEDGKLEIDFKLLKEVAEEEKWTVEHMTSVFLYLSEHTNLAGDKESIRKASHALRNGTRSQVIKQGPSNKAWDKVISSSKGARKSQWIKITKHLVGTYGWELCSLRELYNMELKLILEIRQGSKVTYETFRQQIRLVKQEVESVDVEMRHSPGSVQSGQDSRLLEVAEAWKRRDTDGMKRVLEELEKMDGSRWETNPHYYNWWGNYYSLRARKERRQDLDLEALQWRLKALPWAKDATTRAKIRCNIGNSYCHMGNVENAKKMWLLSHDNDPHYLEVLRNLAETAIEEEDRAATKVWMRKMYTATQAASSEERAHHRKRLEDNPVFYKVKILNDESGEIYRRMISLLLVTIFCGLCFAAVACSQAGADSERSSLPDNTVALIDDGG